MRWVLGGVLGLLLLAVLLWLASHWWPLPVAQRQALALLQAPLEVQGRNGFAQLWLLGYDGPDEPGRDALLAQDVQRWQHGVPGQRMAEPAGAALVAVDLTRGGRCGDRGVGCLAAVRAEPQRYAAAHHGHQALHARVAGLAAYDHFSTPFMPAAGDVNVPLPALLPLMDAVSAHALAFVQGDHSAGLQGSCADILSGRRLLHGSDTLVSSVVGAAMVETNARVLADMLAELPADQALPAVCTAALQPMSVAEQDICPALRGEFALANPVLDVQSMQRPWRVLLFDPQRTQLRLAPHYAWACGANARQALAEDRPLAIPPPPGRGMPCLSNALGCILADVAIPAMRPYAAASQDAAAMLRLVAAQRWLRQQHEPPLQALAQLPAALRSPTRVPQLSADGRSLQVARRAQALHDRVGPVLQVPLPGEH